jgi:CRP-like cAMP-binding protein
MTTAEMKSFEPGEIIFRERDLPTYLYRIRTGRVEIIKDVGAKILTLATLVPGDIFGDMALLDMERRSATARAMVPTQCVKFSLQDILARKDALDTVMKDVFEILVQRLRETTKAMADKQGMT